jgi:aspartyl protease family protein
MRHIVVLALGLVGLLLLIGQFLSPVHPLSGPSEGVTIASEAPAPQPSRMAGEGLEILRDESGQFHVDAAVNGAPLRFLVDTGADTVALTTGDAERAGLHVDPQSFQPIVQTASGQGLGTLAKVERLELGTTELRNIDVLVIKDLSVSLLGQSVLARMGRLELKGDRMVLEAPQ